MQCKPPLPRQRASKAWIFGPFCPTVTMTEGACVRIASAKSGQSSPRSWPPAISATRRSAKHASAARLACGVVLIESLT
jgi:hypothetical protein